MSLILVLQPTNNLFILFLLFFGLLYFNSCSNSNLCTTTGNLNIEYYSSGGITGGSSGITIDSLGNATFWKQIPGSKREISKVVKIEDEQIEKICNTLNDSTIFAYQKDFTGNYTTYLNINLNDKENNISFNKSDLPEDMPQAYRLLIKELNNIK